MFVECAARVRSLRVGRFLLAVCLVLAAAGAAWAQTELVNGKPEQVEGSVGVTFWTTPNAYSPLAFGERKYQLLTAEGERALLKGARIEAPAGFEVRRIALGVRLQEASYSYRIGRRETTVTYKEYRISGRWTVQAPASCAEGEYEVRIVFPNVARLRDAIKAKSPSGETSIVLRVRTFRSAQARSQALWGPNLWKGLGCLLGLTVCLALLGFCVVGLFWAGSFHSILLGAMAAFPGWYAALGFFGYTGRALSELHALHPAYALGAGLGINLAYFGLFWLVSGFGRWNRTWAACLGMGALVLFLLAGVAATLPPNLAGVVRDPEFIPYALGAVLPGLVLASLAAFRKRPKPTEVAMSPQAEAGLADVQEHLRRLSEGRG